MSASIKTTRRKARTIFILMGGHDYESSTALLAFASREKADAQVTKCYAYKQTKPASPEFDPDVTTFTEPEWIAYNKAEEAWRAGLLHPGNDYDSYRIDGVEYLP